LPSEGLKSDCYVFYDAHDIPVKAGRFVGRPTTLILAAPHPDP